MPSSIPLYSIPRLDAARQVEGLKIYQFKDQSAQASDLSSIPLKTDIPHRHSFFEVFIILRGHGTHMIDFHNFDVSAPSIHFISPGQVHLLSSTEAYKGYVLVFSQQLWGGDDATKFPLLQMPFFSPLCQYPMIGMDKRNVNYIQNILKQMLNECVLEKKHQMEIIRAYLKIFLLHCEHIYQEQDNPSANEDNRAKTIVANYKILLEQNFRLNHQVQAYAKQLAITPDHLNKICKSTTGQKAGELLLGRILLEAKRLLLYSQMSQKEIAYDLRFKDPSYFSRIFRQKVGISPIRFRKQMQEKYHY